MNINALLMDERDNVVTCVAAVSKGSRIVYRKSGEVCALTAQDAQVRGNDRTDYRPHWQGALGKPRECCQHTPRLRQRIHPLREERKPWNFGAISGKKAGRASATMC